MTHSYFGLRNFALGISLFGALGVSAGAAFADNIHGFEDPALLEKVMAGEITKEEVLATKVEFRTVFRAFYNKVAPQAYVDLATNHAKYPELFPEIKKAETTHVNAERTDWTYKLDVTFQFGIFIQHFYPEGHQVYKKAHDALSEAVLEHNITNYQQYLKTATETTRLIPYKGGMLVHDDVHVVLQKENSQSTMIQSKLLEEFERYQKTFREQLQGSY